MSVNAGSGKRGRLLAPLLLAIGLCSCSDALLEEMARLSAEANRPEILPAAGTMLTAHETITLTFKTAMEPAAVSVDGDMGSPGLSWQTASASNDTLILNQAAEVVWNPGSDKTLTVTVASDGGSTSYSFSFPVFRGVCVRPDGLDGNPGTALEPLQHVSAGIAAVQSAALYDGSGEVHLAEGTYPTNWYGNEYRIEMVAGISLKGGYSSDWTARDLTAYVSTIQDQSEEGGGLSNLNPNCAVSCGSGLTSATVIEGLKIVGGRGDHSAALWCGASSPTIQDNLIVAGPDQSGEYRYALSIAAASPGSPVVRRNTLNGPAAGGGSTVVESYGLYIMSASAVCASQITGNTIYGGTASLTSGASYGTYAYGGNPWIQGNAIHGGTAKTTYSVYLRLSYDTMTLANNLIVGGKNHTSGYSYSVFSQQATAVLRNNTILNGNAETYALAAYGIYLIQGTPTIESNLLIRIPGTDTFPTYGIYEGAGITPASVKNNDLFNYENDSYFFEYRDSAAGNLTSVSAMELDLNTEVSGTASGNVEDNPLTSSDYHLTASSPASVRSGGLDGAALGWGFSTDKDGISRTGNGATGWSMGCYERD